MALTAKSLFNYGIQVTTLNRNLDFKASSGGSILTAVLTLGFYSPGGLAQEVALQLQSVDSDNIYSVTVDRTVLGGTQNRITVSTNGVFLSLLFGTGPNAATSPAGIMGFNVVDYTGGTTYTGSQSTGTILIPDYVGYNYNDSENQAKLFGAVNVATSGLKESVTFNIQYFVDIEFKYEPKSRLDIWKAFFTWSIQQRQFDFTPEISNPTFVYNATLEATDYDDRGLGYKMRELLDESLPNFYTTGPLKFRIIPNTAQFITG
jgi:hypothetical protein